MAKTETFMNVPAVKKMGTTFGDIGGALGRSVREFRQASQDEPDEPPSEADTAVEQASEAPTAPPSTIGDYRPQT